MSEDKKYFDHVAAEHYIPVYAVTTTNNTTIVITERDLQEFIIEQSQIKNINHFSFFMIKKIEKEENLIQIEIDLKKSKQSYFSESNIESEDYWYKFETTDANNFILYLNRALYRILLPEEIKSINVDECSKFVTLFPPSSSSLNTNALTNNSHSNNSQATDSIQPFYVYSRFIEKVRLSISNSNEQPIEKLVSEVSLKNLRKILKYKINKVNIFRDFPDCSKYFEILLIDIIPYSKYTTNLVLDSSINSTISNNIENYVKCLIECIERSKYLTEITFVGELPFGIEDFFSKLSEKKEISLLSLTFKNVQLTKQQLSLLSSSQISSFRFSGQIFDSIDTLLNFIETTNIDLLSIKNSPQTDFLSNLNNFTNITVLSLCKNNIEIGDFFGFLSKIESKIQYLYLSGNKCEKQISNDIQIPKFEEIRLDDISWGDFFLSYFQILLKTQTFIDLSNSKMNENEWNKVFNYLNTTSDGASQLCKLLWNGNQVNKSFFSYLRKCIDSLDSLQIIDIIDQSTEKEIFDEFISFLKEGKKLTNLFIGFSEQESKSMSGNQLKSILSTLLINMKKENSKKFYLSVPNTSSGDEGVDALIDLFNNVEDCKINFITFDGLQPKNPQKYTELFNSIKKYVIKLKSIKNNSYEIQFPKNDLKCLKNQMQENDYIQLRQDFRFILVSHKLDYLHSDFLFNRMVLSPILTKKRFYVKNENDELLFFDLSSNSNLFYNSFSDSNIEKEKTKKKKEEKIQSKNDDESFDSFFEYSDTKLNKKPVSNKNNDNDDEFTESLSDDEIEVENIKDENEDENTNPYKKNKANKDFNDEFYEDIIDNSKNIKSKEINNKNENNINSKNEKIDSKIKNKKEDENNNDRKRKIENSNKEDANENDKSNKKINAENDINNKIDTQKEEDNNNENAEDNQNDKTDHHSSIKNIDTNNNQDQKEEIGNIKSQNINKNLKFDDENNENSASKPIQVRNEIDKKDVTDTISNDDDDENTKSSNDNEKESIHSISESQQNKNSETAKKSMNKNASQNPQFEFDVDENQSDQHKSNQHQHSKNDIKQSDINNQNGIELNENKHEKGNNVHKSNQIQTKNKINNKNDADNEHSSIKNLNTKKNQNQNEETSNIKSRKINQNTKYEDNKNDKTNEENIKREHPINSTKRIENSNQINSNKDDNQILENSKDKNKSDSIENNKNENTISKINNKKESSHLIPESPKHEHSKTTKKSTNKNESLNSNLEFEYEEEEKKEQNDQQESNQSNHSKKAVKHHSSNSHAIESDNNQNNNRPHKSSPTQTRNNFSPNKSQCQESNNSKIGIKNSNIKDKSISKKEKFNHKNESDKTTNNINDKSIINSNNNLKESTHSISKSQQHQHSKTTYKKTSQNSQIEFEYEEEEEQSDQLAIGQKRQSPNMVKLSLYYSKNKKGESQSPHLEIEYKEENESQKLNPNDDNRNDGDDYEFDKIYQEHFSVKSFTPNRNQSKIHKINHSSTPKQNRKDHQHHSKRIKKQGKASSLMSDQLSITSLSYKHKNKSHRMKKREEENYESDSGYDEQDSATLVNKMTNTDQNLTSSSIKRKIYHQTQKIEKVRKVDFLNEAENEEKRKHQANCDDVLMSTQGFGASRRASLPYKGKSLLIEVVEDRGSDIEFPEMDEITLGDRDKNWTAIEEKFSLKNILHDIRANK